VAHFHAGNVGDGVEASGCPELERNAEVTRPRRARRLRVSGRERGREGDGDSETALAQDHGNLRFEGITD
jgi:hypothetical protein